MTFNLNIRGKKDHQGKQIDARSVEPIFLGTPLKEDQIYEIAAKVDIRRHTSLIITLANRKPMPSARQIVEQIKQFEKEDSHAQVL